MWWIFIRAIKYHHSGNSSTKWWITTLLTFTFIQVMNFHHRHEFSLVWWIFIWVINYHHSDELMTLWWVFILFFFYFWYAAIVVFLNLSPSYGWAWPSSAPACFRFFFDWASVGSENRPQRLSLYSLLVVLEGKRPGLLVVLQGNGPACL